jgi:tetratricopeptide (TPR) repeat protein
MQIPRRVTRRCISTALALSVSALPLPALAGPAEGGDTAESLYNEGRALYETADYEGAIELWTKAYAKLEWSPGNAEIKVGLLYNLAGAHEEAFGINNKLSHLNKAMVLLERFQENIPKIYGEGPDADAERDRVEDRMRRIQEKIDKAKADGGGGSGAAEEEFDKAEEAAEDEGTTEPEPEPEPEKKEKKNLGKILMISGGVATGLGVAAGGAAIAFAIMGNQANDFSGVDDMDYDARLAQYDRGYRMNTIAVTNTIISGVLIIGGVTLLAIGMKKKKAEGGASASVTPSFGRGQAGLVLSGRF